MEQFIPGIMYDRQGVEIPLTLACYLVSLESTYWINYAEQNVHNPSTLVHFNHIQMSRLTKYIYV